MRKIAAPVLTLLTIVVLAAAVAVAHDGHRVGPDRRAVEAIERATHPRGAPVTAGTGRIEPRTPPRWPRPAGRAS